MSDAYLIFGYGIPRDMRRDAAYRQYLRGVFSSIHRDVLRRGTPDPLIITSGGKTDCFPPFRRLEGVELMRGFRPFTRQAAVRTQTRRWRLAVERTALSTLENMTGCRDVLRRLGVRPTRIIILCAPTRAMRVRRVAPVVFGSRVRVISVDFPRSTDPSPTSSALRRKERRAIACDLWALRSPQNFKRYHRIFARKVTFLRKLGPQGTHPRLAGKALARWWHQQQGLIPIPG